MQTKVPVKRCFFTGGCFAGVGLSGNMVAGTIPGNILGYAEIPGGGVLSAPPAFPPGTPVPDAFPFPPLPLPFSPNNGSDSCEGALRTTCAALLAGLSLLMLAAGVVGAGAAEPEEAC